MSSSFQPLLYSLDEPGPSFSDKGKAKELIYSTPPPPWYTAAEGDDSENAKLDGGWWAWAGKDESYTSGLPAVPIMAGPSTMTAVASTSKRLRRRSQTGLESPARRKKVMIQNGDMIRSDDTLFDEPDRLHSALDPSYKKPRRKPIHLETVIHRSVDKLFEARHVVHKIQEWQKAEMDGSVLPPRLNEQLVQERERAEREERKRIRKVEVGHARKRRKSGGEVGEEEAALGMERATASMLAHAGFDGGLFSL